jgi:hypothetical protein
MDRIKMGDRLAWAVVVLAAMAAVAGFVTNVYWDSPEMIRQAHAADISILVAVPLLALGLWSARRAVFAGRVVALGVLGFLVYTYALYAFDVRVTILTPLHIAIIGLATWSLFLVVPALGLEPPVTNVGTRLPRRATGGLSLLLASFFALMWVGQMAGAIRSGQLPPEVVELNVPTNIVWTLDLAFALPILVVAGFWLLRARPWGPALAVGWFVFGALTALEILAIFAYDGAAGKPLEAPVVGLFAVMLAVQTALVFVGILPSPRREAVARPSPV